MWVIEKVLNSSVVLLKDEKGQESILVKKGCGYGRKAGETVQVSDREDKMFLPVSGPEQTKLLELLSEIPAVYLEITRQIVQEAQENLNMELNEHIYLALTDHLHFAVERQKQQMIVLNRLFWEIKNFYPREFQVGVHAVSLVKEMTGVELPEEEAANIAFHLVNAQKTVESQFNALRAAKLMSTMVTLVIYTMKSQPDRESIHYSRFISHLQYFAERFFAGKMLDDPQDFLYIKVMEGYPKALECAEKIRNYIYQDYQVKVPNEEVAYLAIHIQRLFSR